MLERRADRQAVDALEGAISSEGTTFRRRSRSTPLPRSIPEAFRTMMLFVTESRSNQSGALGLPSASLPLMLCRRRSPPSPLSAVRAMIRLA